jgi:uncharacterized protein YmfQ (DUF2313 family)
MTAQDYLGAERKLLPRGPAWDVDGTFFGKMLELAAREFARIDADILRLVSEADPRTASVTLLDWFEQWGIPDECLKALGSEDLEAYRQVLLAKITTQGWTFEEFVRLIGATLNYSSVEIGTYDAFTVQSRVDQRVYSDAWKHWFMTVTADRTNVKMLTVDGRANMPLATWGDTLFECLVKSLAPAHLGVVFQYGN